MNIWKKATAGLVVGSMAGLLTIAAWAEQLQDTKALISAHREAAADAQKKVVFHEDMEKHFVEGKGGSKIDMVGHCRYWADYYRKLAAQEEQAGKELEQRGP